MMKTDPYRKTFLFISVALLLAGPVPAHAEQRESVTGIIGAFSEEAKIIKENMSNKDSLVVMGVEFITGELAGRKVVLALTGVGKVNAAMTTTLLLNHFHPSEVIFTGIAGGINPKLQPGDIVIAKKLAQHDLGVITSEGFKPDSVKNPVDGTRNPLFFPSDRILVVLAQRAANDTEFTVPGASDRGRKISVVKGVIVTGDAFIASEKKTATLLAQFGADAVEMEGAAVAQICFQQKVPFIVLRSISDSADHNASHDLRKFYQAAATNSAALTMNLVQELVKMNTEKTTNKSNGGDNQQVEPIVKTLVDSIEAQSTQAHP